MTAMPLFAPTSTQLPTAALVADPPRSSFLRDLRTAVIDELAPEIELTCKIAVLKAAGHKNNEIAKQLGATGAQFKAALSRAAGAAERLDAGDTQ